MEKRSVVSSIGLDKQSISRCQCSGYIVCWSWIGEKIEKDEAAAHPKTPPQTLGRSPTSTSAGGGGATGSTTVRYVHTDNLGGSSVITDPQGNVPEAEDFYPYDAIRIDTESGGYTTSADRPFWKW